MLLFADTPCALCNKTIIDGDGIAFPPIVGNKKDPIWILSDGAAHRECCDNFLYKENMDMAMMLQKEAQDKGNRCMVCEQQSTNPHTHFITRASSKPLLTTHVGAREYT